MQEDGLTTTCLLYTSNVADFTSFSFHAVKNLTTAEGGALTWRPIEGFDDEYIYKQYFIFFNVNSKNLYYG